MDRNRVSAVGNRPAAFACVLLVGLAVGCGGSGGGGGGGGGNPPVVTRVTPSSGVTNGGATVQIFGGNFTGTPTVTFGGVNATNVVVVNSATINVTTPGNAAGTVEVSVTTDNGTGSAADAFTYVTFPPVFPPTDQQIDQDVATPGAGEISDPSICCSDPYVFVAWSEGRPPGMNRDVWFQGSFDRGGTWRASDVRVNTNTANTSDSDQVLICCSGLTVYVAWMDNRNGTYEPHFTRSVDGGVTWPPNDIRLNTPLAGTTNANTNTLTMCCDGNTVVVGWCDDRNNPAGFDVFTARSIDGGTSFAADKRVSTAAAGTLPFLPIPQLCCEAPNVYITWADARSGDVDVRFNRSTDNGSNWLAADIRLDQDAGTRAAIQPRICCDGGYVYVAWRDDRNATTPMNGFDIYSRSSPNGGANFNASDVRISTFTAGAANAGVPDLCCDGQFLYATWTDNRNIGQDVWFNNSTDGGLTFQLTDTRLDTGTQAGSLPNGDPQICCNDSGGIVVAWDDGRIGTERNIFTNASQTGGSSWLATDARLDSDTPGVGNSTFNGLEATNLCCDGAFFFSAWLDTRNDNATPGFDIFFNSNVP